ncbi:MAG: glycosyltransferase family 9 protein [Elusimicrobia bacterium]|nr:glycosyltransferase family 9 protein [Elusimicrobiota bacterium]
MDVLIVKLAALGDVLRTTSLIVPLRRRYPDCRIWWATSSAARPLLERHPGIERLIEPEELAALPRRFDLVLSLEERQKTARLAAALCRGSLVGVISQGRRLGYTPSSGLYYDMSLLNRDPDGGLERANELKRRNRLSYARIWSSILHLPQPAGEDGRGPRLYLSRMERARARAWYRLHIPGARRPIAFNPGAGRRWPAKQIPEHKAAMLLAALHRRFLRPLLLLGGPEERPRNRDIAAAARKLCPEARIVPADTLGLRDFAAVVETAAAVVSTDSLALHVAVALGRPAVALVGPTSAAELEGGSARVLKTGECACFYRPRCRRRLSCLGSMPEESILRCVARCLRH